MGDRGGNGGGNGSSLFYSHLINRQSRVRVAIDSFLLDVNLPTFLCILSG